MEVVDFRRGQYRRIYSSAKYGRRINSVSDFATRLFWAVVAECDDWGNISADPTILKCECLPLLSRTPSQMSAAIGELISARLFGKYEHCGENFLHVHGHTQLQPANSNGRRVRRWAPSPYDHEESLDPDTPGESGGIRGNPGESNPYNNNNHNQTSSSAESRKTAAAAGFEKIPQEFRMLIKLNPPRSPAEILAAIAAMEARIAAGEKVRNPVGLVKKMLEDGYTPPGRKPNANRCTETTVQYAARRERERNDDASRSAEAASAAAEMPFSSMLSRKKP